jgi:hypothetical protein
MSKLQPFLQNRSCEVLFNLMSSFLTRFVDNEDRASSYVQLFGRSGTLEKIRAMPKGTGQREETAVREFCRTLGDLCGFRYVSEAVILDPEKEKVRYCLVFATNHHKGREVFKNAEMKVARLQDYFRRQTQIQKSRRDELLLDDGPPTSPNHRETERSILRKGSKKFIETLRKASSSEGVAYRDSYCEAMAFPLVTPADFWAVASRPFVKHRDTLFWIHQKKENQPRTPSTVLSLLVRAQFFDPSPTQPKWRLTKRHACSPSAG